MDLAEALGLDARELVAFVGAGGKKTAVSHLAEESSDLNRSVGYTTTTHTPPLANVPTYLVSPEEILLAGPDAVPESIRDESPVAFAAREITNPQRAERKVRGYSSGTVDRIFDTGAFDWLLVKADGARRREFKAPNDDEPVIPDRATRVVPVASVAAVGQPLGGEHVHRPDRVTAITGLDRGQGITPDAVGTVLAHHEGGLKGVPPKATVTPIVNKADTLAEQVTASDVLETAIELSPRIDRGLVTSFETDYCEVVGERGSPGLPG